ncbi:TRM11 family SAM-dependent methyltransferase [Clostridium cylindrosporum]|uniref:DNA methylase N-4/N-6 domain protein n=1 Tax=Clostridium cylindrosporum DSM 605 TaxID=1121307 RepID=A0A0J8DCA2_CLOCY|nr:SAM-dependent methyltransferase [Clostridium cylindrosporum]KMT21883.1 DNA methylase N-4/N-6 domain protein [Clostridium cylindrosporum DSM 605]
MSNLREEKYLYTINYTSDEESLCRLEMKSIFQVEVQGKLIISERLIDPSRSPFIKERLSFIYEGESLENIINLIKADNLSYEDFKVNYVKNEESTLEYSERLRVIKEVGLSINGEADIYNPKIEFGITTIGDTWVFGEYMKHDNEWHIHDKKPYTYSNGLNFKVARSIINIAVGDMENPRIVDPCCGIGTVLMEGLSLGYNIVGYEINPMIGDNAKRNLLFFDYKDVVTIMDMHKVKEKYDACIIDLPYGLFNPITLKEQEGLIYKSREIAEKLVLVTYEEMDSIIEGAGFEIVDRCTISKGKFKRYVTVCI